MNDTPKTNTDPASAPAPAPAATSPPPPPPAHPGGYPMTPILIDRKSAGLAGFLSCFPGLGHLYLGLYQRAFAFGGAFCILVFFNSHGHSRMQPLSGMATFFLIVFAIVDAVRHARAINTGRLSEGGLAPEPQIRSASHSTAGLTWGVILIGLGSLWLIDRYVDIDWSFMERWGFPGALILLGVILIVGHVSRKRKEHEDGVGLPPRSQ